MGTQICQQKFSLAPLGSEILALSQSPTELTASYPSPNIFAELAGPKLRHMGANQQHLYLPPGQKINEPE